MPSLDDVFTHSPRVVARRIAGELLLVPLVGRGADLDSIYNLSRVGAFIWEQLDGGRDGRAIAERLTDHFDVERERAAADYIEFVGALLSVGAVEAVPDSAR